eukprot:TRINITY_DN9305_c0_g1_i1.p1 TRINITY_DN9305_c0_g1~~TRINITY_DN9305_c0_g1_i1.p1  ORF type:complete len:824 (-),score=157.72 TRINITY_DN9305_c0_g1_i1:69-2540(-)
MVWLSHSLRHHASWLLVVVGLVLSLSFNGHIALAQDQASPSTTTQPPTESPSNEPPSPSPLAPSPSTTTTSTTEPSQATTQSPTPSTSPSPSPSTSSTSPSASTSTDPSPSTSSSASASTAPTASLSSSTTVSPSPSATAVANQSTSASASPSSSLSPSPSRSPSPSPSPKAASPPPVYTNSVFTNATLWAALSNTSNTDALDDIHLEKYAQLLIHKATANNSSSTSPSTFVQWLRTTPAQNLTVFAPNDDFIGDDDDVADLMSDDLLNYLSIEGGPATARFDNGTLLASRLRLASLGNALQYLSVVVGSAGNIFVAGVPIREGYQATNGIVYSLDGVPALPQNPLRVLSQLSQYSTVASLISYSHNLQVMLNHSSVTLFAPTNAAFSKLPASLLSFMMDGSAGAVTAIEQIVKNHLYISSHTILYKATISALTRNATINATLIMSNNHTMRLSQSTSGTTLLLSNTGLSRVIDYNILTSTGVVQGIDTVMLPAGFSTGLGHALHSIGCDIFYRTLIITGLVTELDKGNYTVFAPPDSFFDIPPTSDDDDFDGNTNVTTHTTNPNRFGSHEAQLFAALNVNSTGGYRVTKGPFYFPAFFYQDFSSYYSGAKTLNSSARALVLSFVYSHVVGRRLSALRNTQTLTTLSGLALLPTRSTSGTTVTWTVNINGVTTQYPQPTATVIASLEGSYKASPAAGASTDPGTGTAITPNATSNATFVYAINHPVIVISNKEQSVLAGSLVEIGVVVLSVTVGVIGLVALIYYYLVSKKKKKRAGYEDIGDADPDVDMEMDRQSHQASPSQHHRSYDDDYSPRGDRRGTRYT